MSTRTRRKAKEELFEEPEEFDLDLDALSSDELEKLLFDEPEEKQTGIFNLPTIAGFSLILVGASLIMERVGLWEVPLPPDLVSFLPWFAAVLIMLLGFGVLSWRPKKKKKVNKLKFDLKASKPKVKIEKEQPSKTRRLTKSRDKKIAGVAGGIAEYFNIDPTLVRIAFVIGAIFSFPSFFFAIVIAYFILSKIMPGPEGGSKSEERITIIRDS